jgi:4-amino-4-deoxy-L-arabinose transferase-like glycosyltransferase
VTVSTETAPEKSVGSFAARCGWVLLIAATLYACYFSHLGGIGFVGPDEPRYAWVAREMAESGDWVTPTLYGQPWFEKPPLYYWGAALSFELFGVSETSARLPCALSALFATLALGWCAWRIYGPETARWLLLLLPTTVAMIGFSHAAATDMPFAAMVTAAMVCAAILLRLVPVRTSSFVLQDAMPVQSAAPPTLIAWMARALFGIFLGLAVLAKGPAALILGGGAVFFWALVTARWRHALRLLHPAAILGFCVTALPWYILCARRNADFLRVFILEHNFKRYLTSEFQHIQPFWFYLPVTLAAMLPWTFLLIPASNDVKRSLRERRQSGAAPIFLASWATFVLAFFSFSQSKLPGYVLPAIPPLALLCAAACRRLVASKSHLSRALLGGTSLIAIVMIAAGADYALRLLRISDLQAIADYFPLGLPMFGLGLLLVFFFPVLILTRYRAATLFCLVLAVVVLLLCTPLNALDSALSPRQTARAVAKVRQPGEQTLLCDIPRSFVHGFSFYLHQEAVDWSRRDPARRALVIIGSPACWSAMKGTDYHLRTELDFARWPVAEVAADQRPALPLGGSRNKK